MKTEKKVLIYEDLTYSVRKSIFSVFNTLGPGLREETYKQALKLELSSTEIPFSCETSFPIVYRGQIIDEYRVDLIVYEKIILELKAVAELHPRFEAQLLSYLKVSKLQLGLLINFGTDQLSIKRLVNPHFSKTAHPLAEPDSGHSASAISVKSAYK